MATSIPSRFSIQFLEQLLKFLVDFTLLKYVKSQGSYDFLITKELIFGFQILDLKDHFSASLRFLLFNIRPRKDMKAIFDKIQFFTIILSTIPKSSQKHFDF